MNGRHGNVQAIRLGLLWQRPAPDQRLGQGDGVTCYPQQSDTRQLSQALICGFGVAGSRLIENQLRCEKVEPGAAPLPPFPSYLLMGGDEQVSAGLGYEIADNGSFNVYLRFHESKNSNPAASLSRLQGRYRPRRESGDVNGVVPTR